MGYNESLYHFLLKHIRHISYFKSVTFNVLTLSLSIQMLKVTLGLALVTLVACSQCPNNEVCEAGQTCCQDPTGEFSCCPFHHVRDRTCDRYMKTVSFQSFSVRYSSINTRKVVEISSDQTREGKLVT